MSRSATAVAIVGGGVGGLVLAAALSKSPAIAVDVYEAAHEFAEVGAGVGVWPRAWNVLQALGLADVLAEVATVPPENVPSFHFRKGDEPEGGYTFQEMVTPGGMITFHRPDFQRVLLAHLATTRTRLHTRKRLAHFTQPATPDAPIELTFADGATARCDLLVGADGLKSVVRAGMLRAAAAELHAQGHHADAEETLRGVAPLWSGTTAYRATIPTDVLRARCPGHRVLDAPYVYLGRNAVTTYPIARGALVSVAACTASYEREGTSFDAPWVQDVPRDTLRADLALWEPEVQALFDCVQSTSRWAVHTTPPLRSFVSGRAVLLGDAAHAMMPYQGSGAGQAIEDAHVLAALLLAHHPAGDLRRAAAVYDAVRRPAAQRVAALSREAGVLYTLNAPGLAPAPGGGPAARAALEEVFVRLRRNWAWAWETSADEDVRRAVRMLDAGERPF